MNEENFEEELKYREKPLKSVWWLVPISIVVAGLIIGGAIYFSGKKEVARTDGQSTVAQTRSGRASLPPVGNRDAVLGNPEAPVTLIEYGDYQCPFCGRFFHQVEPLLRDEYIKTGKVRMVYRNFQFLGAESVASGAAAECAEDQGKFWVYHDELYKAETADSKENSGNLNRDLFLMLAQNVSLDMTAFTSCLDSSKYVEQVKKDTAGGQALGVSGTPTTYINGEKVVGAQPYSAFKNLIDIFLQSK